MTGLTLAIVGKALFDADVEGDEASTVREALIGESFAWTELVLVLATIARRWELWLVPGHPVGLAPLVTLRPKHGMRMTVHRRHGTPGYG